MKADVTAAMKALTMELGGVNARREVLVGAIKGLLALNGNGAHEEPSKPKHKATKKRTRRLFTRLTDEQKAIIGQRMNAAPAHGAKRGIAREAAKESGASQFAIEQKWKKWLSLPLPTTQADPREKGDDDGREYANPRDAREERES